MKIAELVAVATEWRIVPKGGENVETVQHFINSSLLPERQVDIVRWLYSGPTNPEASAMLPQELVKFDPGHEGNVDKVVVRDEERYANNYNDVLGHWITAIAS